MLDHLDSISGDYSNRDGAAHDQLALRMHKCTIWQLALGGSHISTSIDGGSTI